MQYSDLTAGGTSQVYSRTLHFSLFMKISSENYWQLFFTISIYDICPVHNLDMILFNIVPWTLTPLLLWCPNCILLLGLAYCMPVLCLAGTFAGWSQGNWVSWENFESSTSYLSQCLTAVCSLTANSPAAPCPALLSYSLLLLSSALTICITDGLLLPYTCTCCWFKYSHHVLISM